MSIRMNDKFEWDARRRSIDGIIEAARQIRNQRNMRIVSQDQKQ